MMACLGVAQGLKLTELKLLTALVPIALEWGKTAFMLRTASSAKQMKVVKLLAVEGAKFVVVVAVLLAFINPMHEANKEYSLFYCAAFVVAQLVGAIIYSVAIKSMTKK